MNVIAMVAAQHLAVAAHQEGAAIGWSLIVAIPSAIVAMIGILAYIIGVRRPFDITDAQYYWKQHSPPTVGFRCVIRNRSPLWDRTVTRLAVVEPDENHPYSGGLAITIAAFKPAETYSRRSPKMP